MHHQSYFFSVPPTPSIGHDDCESLDSVFWVDVPFNHAAIDPVGRPAFPSLCLPHHQLVIMKPESLICRQIVNAETDR